jgi:hypothetical protein
MNRMKADIGSLDYARMSNKKGLKVGSENGQAGGTMISSCSITTFDLGNLVETVVEGILAGHGYRTQTRLRTSVEQDHHFVRRRSRVALPGMKNDVSVSFKIDTVDSFHHNLSILQL